MEKTGLALLGAGIFARSQYVPVLKEMTDLISLRAIWSRSEAAAQEAVSKAREVGLDAEAKWGDAGLQEILQDAAVHGVLVVLPPQVQLHIVSQALKAGKHVLQEKPVGSSVAEVRQLMSEYVSMPARGAESPIWAVAENYRFEPGLFEGAKMVESLGNLMVVEVIVESPMQPANPYFSSAWRRDPSFEGGFIKDGGVHFIAGLRLLEALVQITGCEVNSVSAITKHADKQLPPPDNVSALVELDKGCAGVVVMSWSSTSRKVSWRVVGSKGTVEVERTMQNGNAGYLASFYPSTGEPISYFSKFQGVQEELKAFAADVANVVFKGRTATSADKRSSVVEAVRDLAVIEAMLQSGVQGGRAACTVDLLL